MDLTDNTISMRPTKITKAFVITTLSVLTSILIILQFMLSIISLFTHDWVKFSYSNEKFIYGIFECSDCPLELRQSSYSCLAVKSCKLNANSSLCHIANTLNNSKIVLLTTECMSYILSLLLIERLIYIIFKKPFGNLIIFYILAVLLALTKIIGLAVFAILSDTSFTSDCDAKTDICAGQGP